MPENTTAAAINEEPETTAPEPEAVQDTSSAEEKDTSASADAAEPAEHTEAETDAALENDTKTEATEAEESDTGETTAAEPPVVRAFIGAEHRCVVDEDNLFITFCVCNLFSVGDGIEVIPQGGYKVPDGCCLLAAKPPTMRSHAGTAGFITPKWDEDTEAWIEAATAEEIAAWEAEHPDPVPLEDKRAAKTAEMSAACNAAITAGMDVTTTQGTEHFSLQETDQINLTAAVTAVQQGAAGYPYHADGELCRMFTAAEIGAVGQASIAHKLYHTTYCNHLFAWIRRATAAELAGITYGAELPEDLAASMQALLAQAGGAGETEAET